MQQTIDGVRMGEIHMAQGAALTALQAPAVAEVDLDEAIAVATRHGGCADRDRHQLIRVDRLELQLIAPLFQAQTKADVEVLSAAAKGITVAVQIAAAMPLKLNVFSVGSISPSDLGVQHRGRVLICSSTRSFQSLCPIG